jgi:hypothetical protein
MKRFQEFATAFSRKRYRQALQRIEIVSPGAGLLERLTVN